MNILIIGATSAVAIAYAQKMAKSQACFYLVGRSLQKLEAIKKDLTTRGAESVQTVVIDLSQAHYHQQLIGNAFDQFQRVDIALVAHGTLPNQSECEKDIQKALSHFNINATVTVSLLSHLANAMEKTKRGSLVVITSVAADRGRASNYLYGCAKAAVSAFVEGLRGRLFKSNIHVLEIKPGFIASPMTAQLDLPKPLLSTPEKIACIIDKAITRKKNCVYAPFYWWFIMVIIRSIPRAIFKKINL